MSPDADAVGSSVALRNTILDFGGTATIVLPDEYPEFISWMSPDIKILKANTDIEKVEKVVSEADVVFLLDYNNLSRVGEVLGSLIEKSSAVKILVDHHQQPDEFDYVFSDTKASSTCEMICDAAVVLLPVPCKTKHGRTLHRAVNRAATSSKNRNLSKSA